LKRQPAGDRASPAGSPRGGAEHVVLSGLAGRREAARDRGTESMFEKPAEAG